MKRKVLVMMSAIAIMTIATMSVNAADLSFDGMSVEVPDTWIESAYETGDDGSINITYLSGNGGMNIFTTPYDEELSAFSYILLDGALVGIEQMEGYSEVESGTIDIDGKEGHATTFLCDGNMGMLVSVDTGSSIANILYLCPMTGDNELDEFGELIENIKFGEIGTVTDSEETYTKYITGNYKVGVDVPAGEYVVFANSGAGYFCVSSDSNKDDILFNENFVYNSIITIRDGEYLELSRCYAVPLAEDPEIALDSVGMFKVGVHIPAGEYKLETTADNTGYYCIYTDSRQDDIISNDLFEGQNYVTVSDGQYLVIERCKFTDPPSKPIKSYTDTDTAKKVQEALNAAGYD